VLSDWALTIYLNVIARSGVSQPANDLEWVANNVVWGVMLPFGWLAFAIVGALILSRRPSNTIGWLCLAFGAFGALEDLPWQLARIVASSTLVGMLSLTASVFYALYLPTTLTLMLLHFPNGRYFSSRWRSIGLVAAGSAALAIFAGFIRPVAWVGNEREVANPLWLMSWSAAQPIRAFSWSLDQTARLIGLIALGAAVASLVLRWRRAGSIERQQLKWLTFACVVSVVFALLGFASGQFTPFTLVMGSLALAGFAIGVPVAIGIAILRHHLWDIDLVINRALVYGALTALVAGVYALAVGLVGQVMQSQNEMAVAVLALTCAVAIALAVRRYVQRGVDRLLSVSRHAASRPEPDSVTDVLTNDSPNTTLKGAPLIVVRAAWLLLFVMALLVIVALFPINWRNILSDWQVAASAPAVFPLVGSLTYVRYVLVLRYLAVAVFLGVAVVIAWRKSNDWMALLAAGMLVALPIGFNLGGYTETWAWYPATWREPLRLMRDAVSLAGILLFVLLAFLFPDGRFAPRWMRWVILLPLAMTGLFSIALFIGESAIPAPLRELPWLAWFSAFIVGLLAAAAGQIYRYRRLSSPVQRQQTRLVVFGLACFPVTFLLVMVFSGLLEHTRYWPAFMLISIHAEVVMLTLLPITLGVSVLRYRLWDVAPFINRTLVYGALIAVIAILYVLIVGGLSAVFQSSGDLLIAVIATGLIAVLFNPLRVRVQRAVNRALYGERDDPAAVLSQLGDQLASAAAPDAALKSVVDTVAHALKLPYAEISLKQDDTFKTIAVFDKKTGRQGNKENNYSLPLIHQGETAGELCVAPRAPGEAFSAQDMALLKNIAHQAGATAHAALLMRDLQRSRERIVTAREEERRRLRRDLHDGLGPTLASQTLKLDAAMDLIEAKPDEARELLHQLRRQTQTTVADVRRLVYELRPPALDEQGLTGAIRNFAASINGLNVTVDVRDVLPPLPAAVEVAAYRIATEAITNVIKHANATRCVVAIQTSEVSETPEVLRISVADDGIGIDPSHPVGVGLRSMRERAEELGGTLTIESEADKGTRVAARLPLPSLQ
jgi:signal transduction histidine kinase